MRRLTGVLALSLSLMAGQETVAQSNSLYDQAASVRSSIARVRAMECAGRPAARFARSQTVEAGSVGSGFVWNDRRTVVTALHVVAGCSSVEITFGNSGAPFRVISYRADRRSDLALLTLDQDAPGPPLPDRDQIPPGFSSPSRIIRRQGPSCARFFRKLGDRGSGRLGISASRPRS